MWSICFFNEQTVYCQKRSAAPTRAEPRRSLAVGAPVGRASSRAGRGLDICSSTPRCLPPRRYVWTAPPQPARPVSQQSYWVGVPVFAVAGLFVPRTSQGVRRCRSSTAPRARFPTMAADRRSIPSPLSGGRPAERRGPLLVACLLLAGLPAWFALSGLRDRSPPGHARPLLVGPDTDDGVLPAGKQAPSGLPGRTLIVIVRPLLLLLFQFLPLGHRGERTASRLGGADRPVFRLCELWGVRCARPADAYGCRKEACH